MYRSLMDDLRAAVPECTGRLRLPGLTQTVEIWRDRLGIPHVRAQSVSDTFFAQGFVHAQDRLWQMAYDRHRAYGRVAEYLGVGALRQDLLLRRLRLGASARADYGAVNAETRAMLEPTPLVSTRTCRRLRGCRSNFSCSTRHQSPGSPGMLAPCSKCAMCSPAGCGRGSSACPAAASSRRGAHRHTVC